MQVCHLFLTKEIYWKVCVTVRYQCEFQFIVKQQEMTWDDKNMNRENEREENEQIYTPIDAHISIYICRAEVTLLAEV